MFGREKYSVTYGNNTAWTKADWYA